MKIILSENQLSKLIKLLKEEIDLPDAPARRVYNILMEKGYLNENSEVNVGTDTLEIYSLPYPAPEEYFTDYDGYLIIVVPYLFEDEGGTEIQFEDENTKESSQARFEVKDYIASTWDLDFPIDFDDDYLSFSI